MLSRETPTILVSAAAKAGPCAEKSLPSVVQPGVSSLG